MNNKFLPDQIIETRDSSGRKHFSEVYSREAWGNKTLLYFIFVLVCGLFVTPILPILIGIFSFGSFNNRSHFWFLIGIAISIFFLFVMKNNLVVNQFISNLLLELEVHQLTIYKLIVTGLVINFIFLFFGSFIGEQFNNNETALFLCGCLITFFTYRLFSTELSLFILNI